MDTQRIVVTSNEPFLLPKDQARTRAEKVAILLAALENSVAVNLLKKLEPSDVKQIVEASGKLGSLNFADVNPLIEEFSSEFSEALGISAGSNQMASLMETAFSSAEVAQIMGREPVHEVDSVWPKFKLGAEVTLVPYLLDESEQAVAVILSKIMPELAARCIAIFPRGLSTRIISRMLNLSEIVPFAFTQIEDVLREDFFAVKTKEDKSIKIDKLAALVNRLDRQRSLDVLQDLAASNPDEMKLLRKLIFMFEDIENMAQSERLKLFDKVPTEIIISALFGTEPSFREAILSSMGARARRMVESELQGDTSKAKNETPGARRKIADTAIQMSRSGQLELPTATDQQEVKPTEQAA